MDGEPRRTGTDEQRRWDPCARWHVPGAHVGGLHEAGDGAVAGRGVHRAQRGRLAGRGIDQREGRSQGRAAAGRAGPFGVLDDGAGRYGAAIADRRDSARSNDPAADGGHTRDPGDPGHARGAGGARESVTARTAGFRA